MASVFNNELVAKMADFLNEIGIPVAPATLDETPLPGIRIVNEGLLIDEEKLTYPGDILHEAGHIAVAPPSYRKRLSDRIDPEEDFKYAGELMTLGWSYAAAVHLGIDPAVVFHSHGYRGQAQQILDGFTHGVSYIGLPALQWAQMTATGANAEQLGVEPYPHMIRWVREHEPEMPTEA